MHFNVACYNGDVTIENLNNLVFVIDIKIWNSAKILYIKTYSWKKYLPKNKTS